MDEQLSSQKDVAIHIQASGTIHKINQKCSEVQYESSNFKDFFFLRYKKT